MSVSSNMIRAISAPEQLETRLGTLEFVDGVPTEEAAEKRIRPSRLPARPQRLSRRLRGGVDLRGPERLPRHRRGGQLDPHLLGADGLGVRVPDRERRHGLLPRHRRSHVGADGGRDAPAGARCDRRHVVGLDHRLRPAGPGSRRRRPVPARPARLRRPAAGQRLPRRTLAHVEGARARAVVPDERRPGADRRDDQEHDEDLPLRAGRRRHERGDAAQGRRAARCRRRGSRDRVRRGQREGVQHGAAERLRLLRADERGGPGRARRQHQPRAPGTAGRDRDRQGPAVRARRADARHPRGRGRRRQRDLAGAVLQLSGLGRVRVLRRRLGVVQHAVGRRVHVRDAAAARHEGGDQAVPRDRRPEAPFPYVVPLRGHGGLAGDVHAAHRSRISVPDGRQGLRRKRLRRLADLPGDAAARHSGSPLLVVHCSTTTRLARCSRRRSASRGPAASPIRPRRRPRTPTARRPSRSAPKAGRHSGGQLDPDHRRQGLVPDACASTARSSRSSTRVLAAERDRACD